MMLIDGAEVRFDIAQGGLQNAVEDAPLFVTEQRLQGIRDAWEITVKQTDQFRDVSSREGMAGLLKQSVVGASACVLLHSRREVVVSEVKHGKAHMRALPSDPRKDFGI